MPSGVFVRTPEHIANIKKANTGLKRSEETRKRISEAKKGRKLKPPTPERAAQNSANRKAGARRGKDHHFFGKGAPEWALAKISATHKGMSYKVCRQNGIDPEAYKSERAAGRFWCGACKQFVPDTHKAPGIRRNQCQTCAPKVQRISMLRRVFGVDAEWYDARLVEQGGVCAICKSPDKVSRHGFLAIDHSHSRTENPLRGLLCAGCNTSLGIIEGPMFGRFLEYLDQYGDRPNIPEPQSTVVR